MGDDSANYGDYEEYPEYEEEEPQPAFNPQFTTEAQNFKIEPGHTFRLPCQVDKLGKSMQSRTF